MPPRPRLQHITGLAAREIVRPGTAGQHEAVVLRLAGGGRLILQRRGGNAFSDPQTRGLAGHKVRVSGYRAGDIFRYVSATVVDP